MTSNRSIMDFFGKKPSSSAPKSSTSRPVSKTASVFFDARKFTPNHGPVEDKMGQIESNVESEPLANITNIPHEHKPTTKNISFPQAQSTVEGVSQQQQTSQKSSSEEVHKFTRQDSAPSNNATDAQETVTSRDTETPNSADSAKSTGRVIKSSDDEEENDSDSSLEDLNVLLSIKKPTSVSLPASRPKTPPGQPSKDADFHKSPLSVRTKKPKFDMVSLLDHARKDESTEASSKRMKALMGVEEGKQKAQDLSKGLTAVDNLANTSLLETVVKEQDEGDMAKVTRALMRTEATMAEKRFYFFEHTRKLAETKARPFPKGSALKGWEDLRTQQIREQHFVSGFVEDVVALGTQLPHEIVSWILEATCLDSHEVLRYSYLNILQECPDQIHTLLTPAEIQRLFRLVGARVSTTSLSEKILPTAKVADPYWEHDWSKVCTLLKVLGRVAPSLSPQSRIDSICMLLRMAADSVVLENVEILMEEHKALWLLLRCTPDENWESECTSICRHVFRNVQQASLRQQVVASIPSVSLRLHDLRRRIALCSFFDNDKYCSRDPYKTIDIEKVIDRLEHSDFYARPTTDYHELTALIRLLDVAVDDGRSADVDLGDPQDEKVFNKSVDDLVLTIKDIMTNIGNPGAAFISRIQAKETLELVSQRIADTVRTKRKSKESWFNMDITRAQDKWASEKKGLSNFITKKGGAKEESS